MSGEAQQVETQQVETTEDNVRQVNLLDVEIKAAEATNKTSQRVLGLAELIVNRGFTSSDVEKFLVRFSNFVRETEPGTYDFGYFISKNSKKVNLVEKYYTSDDFVHHLNNFEKS